MGSLHGFLHLDLTKPEFIWSHSAKYGIPPQVIWPSVYTPKEAVLPSSEVEVHSFSTRFDFVRFPLCLYRRYVTHGQPRDNRDIVPGVMKNDAIPYTVQYYFQAVVYILSLHMGI